MPAIAMQDIAHILNPWFLFSVLFSIGARKRNPMAQSMLRTRDSLSSASARPLNKAPYRSVNVQYGANVRPSFARDINGLRFRQSPCQKTGTPMPCRFSPVESQRQYACQKTKTPMSELIIHAIGNTGIPALASPLHYSNPSGATATDDGL